MNKSDKDTFLKLLTDGLQSDSFVKLTLGKYRGAEKNLKNIYIRLVEIKNIRELSFIYRYDKKDIVKNYLMIDGINLISDFLGKDFYSANLFTLKQNVQIEYSKKLKTILTYSKPTFTEPPPRSHNKEKQRIIGAQGNLYLSKLGVTNEQGEVREKQGDKFRQINKFIEIVSSVFKSSQLVEKKDISIVDMGSGKVYLTFALYDYFANILKIKVQMIGVESREDLVEIDNNIANELQYNNLHFVKGLIQDYDMKKEDVVVALHACNTATDDAIFKGIAAGASIIICAPCCHKQIRPQIVSSAELAGVLDHGILLERQAVIITDSMRALLLELCSYKTKVFEFISAEHTDKNIMIVGVKQGGVIGKELILKKIEGIKKLFGIKEHHLEYLLRLNKII
jgi:Methyltransferase domain